MSSENSPKQTESGTTSTNPTNTKEDALSRFKRVFGIARPNPAIPPLLKQPSTTSQTLMIASEAFELVKSLQSGGFANVVEILHVPTRKRYALKKTALEYLDYAENEVQVMLDLRSSSRVIKLYSHQNGPDVFFTVMELGGVDFFDLTGGRRVKDPILRRKYFRQMCLCVQQLHHLGKIHRDLKRENFISALPEPCPICFPTALSSRSLFAPAVPTSPTPTAATPAAAAVAAAVATLGIGEKCPHRSEEEVQLKLTDFGCTVTLPSYAAAHPASYPPSITFSTTNPFIPRAVVKRAVSLTPLAQRGHQLAHSHIALSEVAQLPPPPVAPQDVNDRLGSIHRETREFEEIYCVEEVGTDVYLPPEAATTDSNQCYRWNQRSDIWALGVMLFEMTWGRRPFVSRQTVDSQPLVLPFPGIAEEDPAPHEVETDDTWRNFLFEVLRWCLEKDARRRPSIDELMTHPYLQVPLPPPPADPVPALSAKLQFLSPFLNNADLPPPPPLPPPPASASASSSVSPPPLARPPSASLLTSASSNSAVSNFRAKLAAAVPPLSSQLAAPPCLSLSVSQVNIPHPPPSSSFSAPPAPSTNYPSSDVSVNLSSSSVTRLFKFNLAAASNIPPTHSSPTSGAALKLSSALSSTFPPPPPPQPPGLVSDLRPPPPPPPSIFPGPSPSPSSSQSESRAPRFFVSSIAQVSSPVVHESFVPLSTSQ